MNKASDVRVLIDHADPLVAAGVAALLSDQPDISVLATHPEVAGEEGPSPSAHVLVTDIERALSRVEPDRGRARLLVISGTDSEHELRRAIRLGACVLQSCAPQDLIHGVRRAGLGLPYICPGTAAVLARGMSEDALTGRQIEVLRLVVEGRGNRTIARELGVAEGTVKTHIRSILERLRASSRVQAAVIAQARGLVEDVPCP